MRYILLVALLVFVALVPPRLSALRTVSPSSDAESTHLSHDAMALVESLREETVGHLRIGYHQETGAVRFIGTELSSPVRLPRDLAPMDAAEAAQAHLSRYGVLFGISDPERDLALLAQDAVPDGRTILRYRQQIEGIPVFGGEIVCHLDRSLALIAVAGETSPVASASAFPSVTAAEAREVALECVAKQFLLPVGDLESDDPTLWFYDPALLGAPGPPGPRLVWRTEITTTYVSQVREVVLVDAETGTVALHFSQASALLNRLIYDGQDDRSLSLPGIGPIREEGDGPVGLQDADLAYAYAGDTYAFYAALGRDSIDNAGMPLISTVRYCSSLSDSTCPYRNAFWNGYQMVYGRDIIADDVVAHEMTHGVTEYSSGLFYYMQSGAINEGFSDAFGELVDLTNGAGNDSAGVRWWIGEDLPPGIPTIPVPLRRMDDPTATGQPDRMSSPLYVCGALNDYGGVHTNCGVMSKAVYLMTDGGTFNGWTVQGLGAAKTARILYEAQTHLLTSASDYADLYDALVQAATNLVGTEGITSSDVEQVRRACLATEMAQQPSYCAAPECPICDDDSPAALFGDDLEYVLAGNWTTGSIMGGTHWYYPQTQSPYGAYDMTYATSGTYNIWGDADLGGFGRSDSYIAMKRDIRLPAQAYLRFNHAFSFEWGGVSLRPDGGVIEYSTDQGVTWRDAGPLCIDNGYNGIISGSTGNPLSGRSAFVGESNGYTSTRLDLSVLAGESVRFRFRLATDDSGGNYGWFIDDIMIYTCAPIAPTATPSPRPTLPPGVPMHLPLVFQGHTDGPKTTIAALDFESPLPEGWSLAGGSSVSGDWLWARSACRASSGEFSGWAYGGGSVGGGSSCGDDYPHNVETWLVYGPFSLADAARAGVTLDAWWHSEQGYDHLGILASGDGTTFYGPLFSGDSGGWVSYTLDLADVYQIGDLCGEPTVWIALLFESDESVAHPEGAYADNVWIWQITNGPVSYPSAAMPSVAMPDGSGAVYAQRTLPQ